MSSTGKSLVAFLAGGTILAVVLYSYSTSNSKLRATIIVSEFQALPSVEPIRATTDTSVRTLDARKRQASPGVIGAFLNGRVVNTGSKQVKQVTLRIPDAEYACVRIESGDSSCQAAAGLVTIGDLGSFESAVVQIWLPYKPNVTAYKDIKLTHFDGVGRIDFEAVQVPPTFIQRYYLTLVLAAALILYALYVYFSQRYANQQLSWMNKHRETAPGKT